MQPARTVLRLRRVCLALHRKLAGWLALLLFVWFASGVVMLFVRYPRLSEAERLAALPTLQNELAGVGLAEMGEAESLVLTTVAGRAAYRMSAANALERPVAVYADGGDATGPVSLATAAAVASPLMRGPPVFDGRLRDTDQWTVNGLDDHLPLLRFRDAEGTTVYVSEATGQAVQCTTASERFWAWLGPIPHWIYPAALRRHRGAWRWLVIALALAGALSCAGGLVGGVLLARKSMQRRNLSPYRKAWYRWHHVLGLAFGVLAFSWTLSGAFSLNPFDWSPGRRAPPDMQRRTAGGALSPASFSTPVSLALRACSAEIDVRELEFLRVAGRPFFRCIETPLRTRLVAGDAGPRARLEAREFLSRDELVRAARAALPGVELSGTRLVGPDNYEYQAHLTARRRFPLLRARFSDPANTTLYLDPSSGAIVSRHTTATRWERWLYHGLHSLDFGGLYRHRAVWLSLMLILLAGGLALSATGVRLLFQRCRRRWMRPREIRGMKSRRPVALSSRNRSTCR